jgi:hypothetical protein
MKKLSILMILSLMVASNAKAELDSNHEKIYLLLTANMQCMDLALTQEQRNLSPESKNVELEMCADTLSKLKTNLVGLKLSAADGLIQFLLLANTHCMNLALSRKQRNPSPETTKDELEMCNDVNSLLKNNLACL